MSTENFHLFAAAVRRQFAEMARERLLTVSPDRDAIWAEYLRAFPPGTDPIFRERTEHDCSCCRAFIREIGGVVAFQNGALTTVWDVAGVPEPYGSVAAAMARYVRSLEVADLYVSDRTKVGVTENHEQLETGQVLTWSHFSVEVPRSHVSNHRSEVRGNARADVAVLRRALEEFTIEAVKDVIALAERGVLYRGAERLCDLETFRAMQEEYHAAPRRATELLWACVGDPVARLRNTAVGTLVADLSAGMPLEDAVRSYEVKVAPQNYRRPTALVTPSMAAAALRELRELGVEEALDRRHARLADVRVDDVLFVDNAVRTRMAPSRAEVALAAATRPSGQRQKTAARGPRKMDVDEFVRDVLPETESVSLTLEARHLRNFVTLTAPAHDGAPDVLRWPGGLAWSYDGDAADSIRERVKRAGGRVEGVTARVSLAWYNYDDLDLHVIEPGGRHVSFMNKCGILDVDMNAGCGRTREPVENLRWVGPMRDGDYRVWVHQYCRRETADPGFEVEVEVAGKTYNLSYATPVSDNGLVDIGALRCRRGALEFLPRPALTGNGRPSEKWGITTGVPVRVDSVLLSPNHWGGSEAGQVHWFFILDGCRAPGPVRGMYNEFLLPALAKHRRALEILGSRLRCRPSDDQVSGVGFTRGRGDSVLVEVSGASGRRSYEVTF